MSNSSLAISIFLSLVCLFGVLLLGATWKGLILIPFFFVIFYMTDVRDRALRDQLRLPEDD